MGAHASLAARSAGARPPAIGAVGRGARRRRYRTGA